MTDNKADLSGANLSGARETPGYPVNPKAADQSRDARGDSSGDNLSSSSTRVVHDVSREAETAGYPVAPRYGDQSRDARGNSDNEIRSTHSDPKAGQHVAKDAAPAALDGDYSVFGQLTAPASKDVFTTRRGDLNPQPAGDAPPADNTTFRVNKRQGGTTTPGFLESIGD
jgi:hypothetical protein